MASLRLLVLIALATASTACGDSQEADTAPGISQANPLDAEESALLDELNALRADRGVDPVRACTSLNISASKHSDDMRDRGYSDTTSPDGSTPTSRACDAGYQAGCDPAAVIAEFFAYGNTTGSGTLGQWTQDPGDADSLAATEHAVLGVGRSLAGDSAVWSLDLGDVDEASCD